MKLSILFCLLLLNVSTVNSQTEIDEHLTITFPGETVVLDTIIDYYRLTSYSFENYEEAFLVQVYAPLERITKFQYPGAIELLSNNWKEYDFKSTTAREIKASGINGYVLNFVHEIDTSSRVEQQAFILDGDLYTIIYLGSPFNESNKNNFFDSVKFNEKLKSGSDPMLQGAAMAQVFIFLAAIGVGAYFLIQYDKKRMKSE